ncbi:hypothetical protein ABZZ20_25565 [Streptomyces sp. NPDC006430]|uniref:hypothetical protein n=1 Tax=Streptomyces sp. NPDC006430 TaxID=3154299 RepID=UPI0033B8F321
MGQATEQGHRLAEGHRFEETRTERDDDPQGRFRFGERSGRAGGSRTPADVRAPPSTRRDGAGRI